MKAGILGPIHTASYFGGVATFDEGLAKGFQAMKSEVVICTEQDDGATGCRDNAVYSLRDASFRKIMDYERPDVLIASLDYGKYFFTRWVPSECLKVYYLHGFFDDAYYPKWKVLTGSLFQKCVCFASDAVVANSSFTAEVNRHLWSIEADAVIYPGVGEDYLCKGRRARAYGGGGCVLYAGRLHEAKRVDTIVEAVGLVSKLMPDVELIIAGEGPQERELRKLAGSFKYPVHFIGRVQRDAIPDLYNKADVFVSLNDREPFGITYSEALLCGCKIVCPSTGGQIDFLAQYEDRVALCHDLSAESVASKIVQQLSDNRRLKPIADADRFSYVRVASDFELLRRRLGLGIK